MLQTILLVVQVFVSLALIGLVLIQKGKGADAGAGFGAGASGTVFGARGSGNFLSRSTAVLATVFILNSLWLANLAGNRPDAPESIFDTVEQPALIGTDDENLPAMDIPEDVVRDAVESLDEEMPQLDTTESEAQPEPVPDDSASDE